MPLAVTLYRFAADFRVFILPAVTWKVTRSELVKAGLIARLLGTAALPKASCDGRSDWLTNGDLQATGKLDICNILA